MIDFRIMVDSAPLFERSLAVQTGRGFIGRNSCYILPDFGSYVVLGEIVTTTAFHWDTPIDQEAAPACQSCRRCQSHCPTGALQNPYSVDARRCLSYWTIEHQGLIPVSFWPHLKTFYFGCDVCQQVCPFNSQIKHKALDNWIKLESCPDLMTVATMNQKKYEELFGGTPLTRAKIHGLRRNALIAMHVTAHPMIDEALAMIDVTAHPVLSQTRQQILDQRVLEADTFSQ
jgi:epoxyqueuosine reductase